MSQVSSGTTATVERDSYELTALDREALAEAATDGLSEPVNGLFPSEYVYSKKLTVTGKYHIICSLHEEMTMDITVR